MQTRLSAFAIHLNPGFALLLLCSLPAIAETPAADGKQLTERVCGGCHAMNVSTGGLRTSDGWQRIVDSMMERGAVASESEVAAIVNYLAKNFGKADRPSVKGAANPAATEPPKPAMASIPRPVQARVPGSDWPYYGHDQGGMRYSPLEQINTTNVTQLERAWTYHTKEAITPAPAGADTPTAGRGGRGGRGGPPRARVSQATPIVIGNVLYLTTPYNRIVALEADTGKEIWKHEVQGAAPAMRGAALWTGNAQMPARIFFGTTDGRLIALNAKTGDPIPGFGNEGEVNLKAGLGDFPRTMLSATSSPLVYHDLVLQGGQMGGGSDSSHGPSGDIRAWDARTGKEVWRFHTVPHAGEPGVETWAGESWKDRSGANVWGLMTVDEAAGVIYAPLKQANSGWYGGDRKGQNLYSTSLVALEAASGKLLWHYQFVHHDSWDYDSAAPPSLIELTRNGKRIPAVVENTKMGLLFILDRRDGKPIFGAEERRIPASDVPGEETWPTQPFPLKPPPLARNSFTRAEIAKVTPEHEKFCTELLDSSGGLHNDGPYTPYEMKPSIVFPGTLGGGNWGGISFDPKLGYIFVNTMDVAGIGWMVKQDDAGRGPYNKTSQFGGLGRFWNPDNRWPCQQPPWGRMFAINANTGDIVWQRPLGVVDELEARGVHDTGALNIGGSIATAGGLIFIGAAMDSRFRAFDSRTGKEVWTVRIDATARTTPVTYLGRDGRQYVVVTAGGGDTLDDSVSDSVIAFEVCYCVRNSRGAN